MRFYRIKKTKYGYLPQTTTLLQWLWYGEWHTIGHLRLFLMSESRGESMAYKSSRDEAKKSIKHHKKISP